MIYQLSYELRTLEKDYSGLYEFIEQFANGNAIHVLRDTWWIDFDNSVSTDEFCKNLRIHMGENDVFFFSEVTTEKLNGWMPSQHWDWVRARINKR